MVNKIREIFNLLLLDRIKKWFLFLGKKRISFLKAVLVRNGNIITPNYGKC